MARNLGEELLRPSSHQHKLRGVSFEVVILHTNKQAAPPGVEVTTEMEEAVLCSE